MRNDFYVHVTGPDSGGISDYSGEEYPVWNVAICNDDDDVVKSYVASSFARALDLGRRISTDRRLELVMDADPS